MPLLKPLRQGSAKIKPLLVHDTMQDNLLVSLAQISKYSQPCRAYISVRPSLRANNGFPMYRNEQTDTR